MKRNDKTIYLDHASTTSLDPRVKAAMEPFLGLEYGNPSSLHHVGRRARDVVERAREVIADFLSVRPDEVIFTAGGTESINMALFGVVSGNKGAHIITSKIEHSAVLKSCEALEKQGHDISYVPVNEQGLVDIASIDSHIKDTTRLISIMYVNNEIGTIQPISRIAQWLSDVNKMRKDEGLPEILFHTDACQAGNTIDLDISHLGVDLLTLNGSKLYGPKQMGILYVKEGVSLNPHIYGGGQERNIRSGTENVAGIVGLAKAISLAQAQYEEEDRRMKKLWVYATERILREISDVRINGVTDLSTHERLSNNIHVSFKGVNGRSLLLYLDTYGICVSTGSACSAKTQKSSHVLSAIGCSEQYIDGSLRISMGRLTTQKELDFFVDTLVQGVELLRQTTLVSAPLQRITQGKLGSCIEISN